MTNIYGLCLELYDWEVKTEGLEQLLKEADEGLYETYKRHMDESNDEESDYGEGWNPILSWMDTVPVDGQEIGITGYIKRAIEKKYKISIYVDSPYIGIVPNLPWDMDESIKTLTLEKFQEILSGYVRMITDETFIFGMFQINDDYDY